MTMKVVVVVVEELCWAVGDGCCWLGGRLAGGSVGGGTAAETEPPLGRESWRVVLPSIPVSKVSS
jgi:hypothetical protein